MRKRILSIILALLPAILCAQATSSVDAEYISICLVDSLSSGQVNRFERLILVSTRATIDIDQTGSIYTPTGTVLTCEEYDLSQLLSDPISDLFPDCECTYTISQENHQVINQNVEPADFFDVNFLSVVRRQCDGQAEADIIQIDTLSESIRIASGNQNIYDISFAQNGDFVDQMDFRVYTSASSSQTVSVDLNPSTVVASYPALTLNTADFSFSGSNEGDIEDAYRQVINYAITQAAGSAPQVDVGVTSESGLVSIRQYLRPVPDFPYIISPHPLDADFSVITGNSATFSYRQLEESYQTSTATYSEQCGDIVSVQSSSFLRWDRLVPLTLLPHLSASGVTYPGANNPSVTCAAPNELCATLNTQNGCFDPCSEILNIAGQAIVNNESTTLEAGVYNSVSIYVAEGPVQITLNGFSVNYPQGRVIAWGAAPNKSLKNSITIDATGGEAQISFVR